MPRRALIERRPWMLGSLVIALVYGWTLISGAHTPGLYDAAFKAVPFVLLAVYSVLRHRGRDTRLLALMFALEAIGMALADLFPILALDALMFAYLAGLGLFLTHRRLDPDHGRRVGAAVLLIATPALCFYAASRVDGGMPVFFGLSLGAMAAGAWMSTFPQSRVGVGAVLLVFANVLGVALGGVTAGGPLAATGVWLLFYCGNVVMASGVTGELRNRARFAAGQFD